MLEAAAQGLGVAFMHESHFEDAHDPRLVRLFDIAVESPYSYWFVCRPRALQHEAGAAVPRLADRDAGGSAMLTPTARTAARLGRAADAVETTLALRRVAGLSQARIALTILPGSRGGSPLGSASISSMPSVTSPQTVYCPSRKRASSKQMKNCELAEFGLRWCAPSSRRRGRAARVENSAFRFGLVRSARAGAGRIAALRHEAGDHAVEHDAVVEAVVGQLGDPLDMLGRQIGAQLDRRRRRRRASGSGVSGVSAM